MDESHFEVELGSEMQKKAYYYMTRPKFVPWSQ